MARKPISHLNQPEDEVIDELRFRVGEQEEMLKEQKNRKSTLETMIENQINRNMRTTLIFRNLNINDTEKAWKDTKSTLAKEILRAIPEFGENSLYFHIEQAVREPISKATKSKYKQLVIITRFVI